MYLRMRGRLVASMCLGIAFCFSGSSLAAEANYRLETKPVRRVKATLTTAVDAPRLMAKEWIVSAPAVPELPSQRDVVQSLSVANTISRESSSLKREIFSAGCDRGFAKRKKSAVALRRVSCDVNVTAAGREWCCGIAL